MVFGASILFQNSKQFQETKFCFEKKFCFETKGFISKQIFFSKLRVLFRNKILFQKTFVELLMLKGLTKKKGFGKGFAKVFGINMVCLLGLFLFETTRVVCLQKNETQQTLLFPNKWLYFQTGLFLSRQTVNETFMLFLFGNIYILYYYTV